MQITARELAIFLHGTVEGNPEAAVHAPAKIEEATVGNIAFLANPKYESFAYSTEASILLVEKNFLPAKKVLATLVRVENVRDAVAVLLEKFALQHTVFHAEISEKADIHPSAKLGKNVQIGAFTVIESEAKIGDDVVIGTQVFVGKNAQIGAKTRLETGVKVLFDCKIGENCHIYAGAVIGSDGFGYAPQTDFSWKKVPQVGNVILENNVEIGANSTIDRATMGSTLVKKGSKIDNLVHLAHNVEVGENCVIAAQVGIAGSAKIGARTQMGGQVGIVGHVSIAEGTKIQAQSGVAGAVKIPNTAIFGSPAIGYTDFQRSFIIFKKLPEISRKIAELERELAKLKA